MSSEATDVQEASPKYGFTAAKPAVPAGYKQTEVGMIPEDWELKQLCEITQIRSGIAKNSSAQVQDPIHVHYLRVANVQDGYLDLSDMSQITISRSDLARFSVQSGDVLMNEGGDRDKLGRGAIWRGQYQPCIHQNHVFVVRPKKVVDPEYLAFWSAGDEARKYFLIAGRQTTNLASINKTSLGQLPVVLPRVSEQRAISTALSDVDALLEELDGLITKKRDIKQATMQQLLTGQTRLSGFKEEWQAKTLAHLAEIRSGGTPSTSTPGFWNGGIPWCTPTDITALRGQKHLTNTERTISPSGLQASSAETIPPNSVIMTTRATIGECAINTVPMTTNQGFKNLVPIAADCEFLYYLMTIQKSRLVQLCAGSTFLEIGKKQLDKFDLYLPESLDEQKAIAAILSDMDTEIDALKQRRAKTAALKQAMMQELLTGRTRLVKPNG